MLIETKRSYLGEKELVLRCPTKDDAAMLIEYLRQICKETRFISQEPEEVKLTIDEEKEFIRQMNISEHSAMLLAFLDGVFVGNASFTGYQTKRHRHRVTLGIGLFEEYTNLGIGRILIARLLEIAKEKGFEQMELEVSSENARAIHLYEKLGFQIYGTFPNSTKYKDGTYEDTLWMMKRL